MNQIALQGSRIRITWATIAMLATLATAASVGVAATPADEAFFRAKVAPIFELHCVRCHGEAMQKGKLALNTPAGLAHGADGDAVVTPGKPDASRLIEVVTGPNPEMPKKGDPLKPEQVEALRQWISAGAVMPADTRLVDRHVSGSMDWWSLRKVIKPELPTLSDADRGWVRTPIDAFVIAKLREQGLSPSPEADRRTHIRRLYFDLIGLPPTPEEVDAYVRDDDPHAYERLVDRLLASPRYGERWARHWLDAVHYGDTHGYDKDKVRPNAWPYRDYVIRAFNEDKAYDRFVREQLAGDVLWPDTADGVIGTGFIASGPFDFVGQIEVRNGTMEKDRVRNLDRDDMVTVAMNTFVSTTVQCSRCHNHKFDPITQADYYGLQAVFAAVDRADREYVTDPDVARRRHELDTRIETLAARHDAITTQIAARVADALRTIDTRLASLNEKHGDEKKRPEYGYHSGIVDSPEIVKWVQVDLGKATALGQVVLNPCHDEFAGIGAGFGFPVSFKVELSDDPTFAKGVTVIADRTTADVPNPKLTPVVFDAGGATGRYLRVTATKLATRQNDYIFALAELQAIAAASGENVARGRAVTSLDSIEAPVRWRRSNLTDGIYFTGGADPQQQVEAAMLRQERQRLLDTALTDAERDELKRIDAELGTLRGRLGDLPNATGTVYAAATDFKPQGNFVPTRGKPRVIHVLRRGAENAPDLDRGPVAPGAIASVTNAFGLSHHFDLPAGHSEGDARVALAEWIVDADNPLTWRSIVNRVWQYHFGHGMVDTPNDFGRMGAKPSHPLLLDWLATWFRDDAKGSIKSLHRMIVMSATYRQSSGGDEAKERVDGSNMYLWRMNRRKLEAEPLRDATLMIAGQLDLKMGGPGFRAFGFKDDHSPHYKYAEFDPDDPASHRRTIYRFIVRSVPDPFMASLDCADPSLIVERRVQTLTATQALALLNNKFMVRMAEHFADRLSVLANDPRGRIDAACRLAFGREASQAEIDTLLPIAEKHGMANVCRILLNTNEFIFVD
ncbi:MAG: DUF1549 domain-containing protein [Phycisphaera sp.]|nr:DUF1549 domain-containing protein [Phycisphaera sp.]